MQMCSIKVYHFILQANVSALKICECNLKANRHILRTCEYIWKVYDHRYMSSYNMKRTYKAAMALLIVQPLSTG